MSVTNGLSDKTHITVARHFCSNGVKSGNTSLSFLIANRVTSISFASVDLIAVPAESTSL